MAMPITAHLPSQHSTPQESSVTPHHRKAPAILPLEACHPPDSEHTFRPQEPSSLALLFPPHLCFHPPRMWLKFCFTREVFVPPSSSSRKKGPIFPIPKAPVCSSDASENVLRWPVSVRTAHLPSEAVRST